MGCATSVVKYILFLFNLLFVLAGLALIALGVVIQVGMSPANKNEAVGLSVIVILFIVVGAVVFLIAFFGCCGAIRESTCMLTTYAVVLLILFILQLGFAIYMFVEVKEGKDSLEHLYRFTIQHEFDQYNSNNVSRSSIDNRQITHKCCGVDGPHDYRKLYPNSDFVPNSCCVDQRPPCSANANVYNEGCARVEWKFARGYSKIMGIVAIVIAAMEIGGAIVALCLASSIRNHERRGW